MNGDVNPATARNIANCAIVIDDNAQGSLVVRIVGLVDEAHRLTWAAALQSVLVVRNTDKLLVKNVIIHAARLRSTRALSATKRNNTRTNVQ